MAIGWKSKFLMVTVTAGLPVVAASAEPMVTSASSAMNICGRILLILVKSVEGSGGERVVDQPKLCVQGRPGDAGHTQHARELVGGDGERPWPGAHAGGGLRIGRR